MTTCERAGSRSCEARLAAARPPVGSSFGPAVSLFDSGQNGYARQSLPHKLLSNRCASHMSCPMS